MFDQACLKKISEQLKHFKVGFREWFSCCELLWQLGHCVYVVFETIGVAVARQLLKGQQKLVCFNHHKGVLTAECSSLEEST